MSFLDHPHPEALTVPKQPLDMVLLRQSPIGGHAAAARDKLHFGRVPALALPEWSNASWRYVYPSNRSLLSSDNGSTANVRLACQLRPRGAVEVTSRGANDCSAELQLPARHGQNERVIALGRIARHWSMIHGGRGVRIGRRRRDGVKPAAHRDHRRAPLRSTLARLKKQLRRRAPPRIPNAIAAPLPCFA